MNRDLGQTVMHKEFLRAVERLKLDSYFKFVGKEEARRLISKALIADGNPGYLDESPDLPDMHMSYCHFTSGVFPRKYNQQINRLLFRITKSNAFIQILDFDQTQLKSRSYLETEDALKSNKNATGEFNPTSPKLVWGEPTFEGQELSIFFINIPRSRYLISRIFKILEAHEALFIEIPKPSQVHNEVMNLTGRINEYRVIIRRSFFNLDSKIRPYYAPKEVRLVDDARFQNDFNGLGSDKTEGDLTRARGRVHLAHRRNPPAQSALQNPERGNEQAPFDQNTQVRQFRLRRRLLGGPQEHRARRGHLPDPEQPR